MRVFAILVILLLALPVFAQESDLPPSHTLSGFRYEAQMWNNCGPATLTMGLSYFGYADNQVRAANWLKPNTEDKNVSPWQMVEFVNTQLSEIPVFAMQRYGGTPDLLKQLIYNGFPVIIEAGYDPERANQGWMGHYLLVVGYNDDTDQFITYDSYDGQNLPYTYDHILTHWQHFNYTYIVLYDFERQMELYDLLGSDAEEYDNLVNTLNIARQEATEDPQNSFIWFNLGTTLVEIAQLLDEPQYYEQAVLAYDQARNLGLPWRMLWYQFGPYYAYNAVGRYDDVITLANAILDNSGRYVEESYYYAGIAREAMGEIDRAISNYNAVLSFNPNFHFARERRDQLQSEG
jgi:tetratricopeptide (TPR) repeat protein